MKLNVSEEIICKCQNHGSCIKQMSPKPYIKRYKLQRDEKLWPNTPPKFWKKKKTRLQSVSIYFKVFHPNFFLELPCCLYFCNLLSAYFYVPLNMMAVHTAWMWISFLIWLGQLMSSTHRNSSLVSFSFCSSLPGIHQWSRTIMPWAFKSRGEPGHYKQTWSVDIQCSSADKETSLHIAW